MTGWDLGPRSSLDGADLRGCYIGYVKDVPHAPGDGHGAWPGHLDYLRIGSPDAEALTDEQWAEKEWAMMEDLNKFFIEYSIPRPGDALIDSSTSMCWNLACYWLGVLDPRPAYNFLAENPKWSGTLDDLTEIVDGAWSWELDEVEEDHFLHL